MEAAFQLKGRLFTLSVLQLTNNNIDAIEKELGKKKEQAPNFFNHAPVVIDVLDLEKKEDQLLDFDQLNDVLKKHNLIPVGICAKTNAWQEKIKSLNLPILNEARLTAQPKQEKSEKQTKAKQDNINDIVRAQYNKNSLIIDTPIRSGQQVYASEGDLVITSTVSPGAELLAEGSIHVYGTLRGRALAGVNGNSDARIFCHRLEANLISIAGQYRLFEDGYHGEQNRSHQIYLKDGQLMILPIN
ncbi:septum site-determining protein MinC [Thiotrichales bacterium 19S11-10]|nr:septum site-determining protein MinC [Thiotrichales bacterium 19S11-10]MCF6807518.1 septum site-determining protein MinC [Thiotrichales bacterium 19S9-11]MCF6811487.1 septum site-determining protein MinC [Thiotrichales bacterium 19S9-12]